MFGFVRRSSLNAAVSQVKFLLVQLESNRQALRRADRELIAIEELCEAGGVPVNGDEIATTTDAVKALIDRVYVAASVVAENEKLNHFNRGMLAEREAAKSRSHAA